MKPRPTRARIDMNRLREGIAGPGSDPRSWVVIGRIDEHEDGVRLEPGTGFLLDVTATSGALAMDTPMPCRVGVTFGGNNSVRSDPVSPGCEVLVVVPDGDANVSPIVIGALQNPEDCKFPETVNGDELNEEKIQSTHVLVTPHAVDEQVAGDIRVKTEGAHRILGQTVELADEGATQPFVKGNALASAVSDFDQALSIYVDAISSAVPLTSPAGATFKLAIVAFTQAVQGALSTRIKGE